MQNKKTSENQKKSYNPNATHSPKLEQYEISGKQGKIKLKPIVDK